MEQLTQWYASRSLSRKWRNQANITNLVVMSSFLHKDCKWPYADLWNSHVFLEVKKEKKWLLWLCIQTNKNSELRLTLRTNSSFFPANGECKGNSQNDVNVNINKEEEWVAQNLSCWFKITSTQNLYHIRTWSVYKGHL